MKAVIQRVKQASVSVDNETIGSINKGILLLLGVKEGDTKETAESLIDKILHLRIFPDENQKMNLSLLDIKGEMLIVSQFTLYGDCSKGRRPSFIKSANPEIANQLYEHAITYTASKIDTVQSGSFGANMQVELLNDGPVTFVLET